MIILLSFAFIAGVITVLSPCILPLLPIILSGSVGKGKSRPLGIITGFVLSFTFFTLFLATIVKSFDLSADTLRTVAVVIIAGFGITLLVPQAQLLFEKIALKMNRFVPKQNLETGFLNGLFIGFSLGLVWTPCVGPIIASVITLAATSTVTSATFLITFTYALGTALPMFAIAAGGQQLLQKSQWLVNNTLKIQKGFGVLMILTAVGLFFQVEKNFQAYLIEEYPSYGERLIQFEKNDVVQEQLNNLRRE